MCMQPHNEAMILFCNHTTDFMGGLVEMCYHVLDSYSFLVLPLFLLTVQEIGVI